MNGGIGKNIASTAVLRSLSAKLKEPISVITGWPLVYHGNPHVDQVWQFGQMDHFYDQHAADGVWLLDAEPYRHPGYTAKDRHLLEVWCELLGCDWDGELPDLFLFKEEDRKAENFIQNLKKHKPVLITQFLGGPVPQQGQPDPPEGQRRTVPQEIAQKIVDRYADEYNVLHIASAEQPGLHNATPLHDQLRVVFAAIKHADKLLLIDSFAQHAAAAFGKEATVLWCGTSPDVLGYDLHQNITIANCPTPQCMRPYSWLFDSLAGGIQWSCPHGDICCDHDPEGILI